MKFSSFEQFKKFIEELDVETILGTQARVFLDFKRNRAIKIFLMDTENDKSNTVSENEKNRIQKELISAKRKVEILIELKSKFAGGNILFPTEAIIVNDVCLGYIMPLAKDAKTIKKMAMETRNQKNDFKENLQVAIELSRIVQTIHYNSLGLILGDVHPCQFMYGNKKVYVCDTDTWGISQKKIIPDALCKPEYVDPLLKDSVTGDMIKNYNMQSDYFAVALVIFELLVGFYPFGGKYKKDLRMKKTDRVNRRISILGNHDIEKMSKLKIQHLAWMSVETQQAFLRIFENNDRFNLLPFLENQVDDLEFCTIHKCYYSRSRYGECPACNNSDDEFFLNFKKLIGRKFVAKMNLVRSDLNWIINKNIKFELRYKPENVRKIIDANTYLDYFGNVKFCDYNGNIKIEKVNNRVRKVYFFDNGIKVVITRVNRLFLHMKPFTQLSDIVNCKITKDNINEKVFDTDDPICLIEIYNANYKKPIYTFYAAEKASQLKICFPYIFYVVGLQLTKLTIFDSKVENEVLIKNFLPEYKCNIRGDFCYLKHSGHESKVIINWFLYGKIPFNKRDKVYIKYDKIQNRWYFIGQNSKTLETKIFCFIDTNNKIAIDLPKVVKKYNMANSQFYNGVCIIPGENSYMIISIRNMEYIEFPMQCVQYSSEISINSTCIDVINNKDNSVYRISLNGYLPINVKEEVDADILYFKKLYYAILEKMLKVEHILTLAKVGGILLVIYAIMQSIYG